MKGSLSPKTWGRRRKDLAIPANPHSPNTMRGRPAPAARDGKHDILPAAALSTQPLASNKHRTRKRPSRRPRFPKRPACGYHACRSRGRLARPDQLLFGDSMNRFLATVALAMVTLAATATSAQPIKLGELNSYKTFPAFLEPYKKGMELAVEEINRSGGVLGRPLELLTRDDNGNAGDAVRVAEELLAREKVDLLMGTFSSAVGLAVADLAKQRHVLFLAAEPLTDKIVWESGNKYTFRLRPSTYMQTAMLVPDAVRLGKRRWAIVYPNYEYGTAATAAFKQLMIARQSSAIEFVEIAVPLGKIDAGPVVQALLDAKPDAIFSSLFAGDLAKFVREGEVRGLFRDRPVVNLLGGEPE